MSLLQRILMIAVLVVSLVQSFHIPTSQPLGRLLLVPFHIWTYASCVCIVRRQPIHPSIHQQNQNIRPVEILCIYTYISIHLLIHLLMDTWLILNLTSLSLSLCCLLFFFFYCCPMDDRWNIHSRIASDYHSYKYTFVWRITTPQCRTGCVGRSRWEE